MSIYSYIPPRIREALLFVRGALKKGKKQLTEEIEALAGNDSIEWYADINDRDHWKKAFKRLTMESDNRGIELAREFYKQPLKIVEEKYKPSDRSIILICAAKNECGNMKNIYSYYKGLGVDIFAFIDNNSTDESVDEYSSMEGVNVFLAEEAYTSVRRQAWINRVMAHYGFDKWYLVVDSDEYIDYNGSEKHSMREVADFCEKKHITRTQALMVDMYPDEIVYENQEIDFLNEYVYFDRDTYEKMGGKEALLLNGYRGGVRARLFAHSSSDVKPWLTKYPLIYIEKGDIQFQSHMSFPFYKNFHSENYLIIRHYKFLPSDLEKYRQRMLSGNFSHGSQEYKQYVAEMEKGHIVFLDDRYSASYECSDSFYLIPAMTRINWGE